MEGEIRNLVVVWISVVASLCYCHTFGTIIKTRPTKPSSLYSVRFLFLVLGLNLASVFLVAPTSLSVAWHDTSSVKALFGPTNFSLCHVSPSGLLPHQNHPTPPITRSKPKTTQIASELCNKAVYIYTSLEIILAIVAAAAQDWLGVELEPQFDEPYLSTSLQDFWGSRWNIMASNTLRSTVYVPLRVSSCLIGREWAPLPAMVAAFLVSGVMHEWIFYNIGRSKPTWEVTWFFVLHWVCLAVEVGVKKEVNGRWRLPPLVSGLTALAVVMGGALWLFLPALMKCNAEVRAHKEMVDFIQFVKNVGIRL